MKQSSASFTSSVLASALVLSFLIYPFSSQALQSKTYTFNASSAFNYDTTGSVSFSGNNTTANWYNTDWKYRQRITISKEFVGDELTDFPVLIRLGDQALEGARDDFEDLVFTSSDGVTKLAHELSGNKNVWVKVPKVSSTEDTYLFVYYGNSEAESQQHTKEVWTNGYASVHHMEASPEEVVSDSTSYDNDGTSNGGMNRNDSLREGKIGRSFDFDGSNDFVDIGSVGQINGAEALTVSLWARFDTFVHISGLITRDHSGDRTFQIGTTNNAGGMLYGLIGDDAGRLADRRGNPERSLVDNKWHHIVLRWAGGNDLQFFVDGQGDSGAQPTAGTPRALRASSGITAIGKQTFGNVEFDGLLDEARIATIARSSAWVASEYANQCNCEDFMTISNTVETNLSESTITLKSDRPLSFTSLKSFKPNTGGTVTYQLSNDAGKTWFFYTKDGWKSASSTNTTHRSSASDISGHLNTFPQGLGKLTWKAYLTSGATLDTIAVGYIPGTSKGSISNKPTSLSDPRIVAINSLFNQVFNRYPTVDEWFFWANRMISGEKTSIDELYGAMQWQKLFGSN